MKNIVVMGECMIEMAPIGNGLYKQSFAGDVYNTAVYLKRILKDDTNVSILTAIGEEPLSDYMFSTFRQEKIGTCYVTRNSKKQVGVYFIQSEDSGERRFFYWRNDSAARSMLSSLSDNHIDQLTASTEMFYFTGISLAVLTKENRILFWQLLSKLKNAGIPIVFDSNYRPALWLNQKEAIKQFEKAFYFSDLVFSGVEDFQQLLAIEDYQDIVDYLTPFNIKEIVIKNADKPMLSIFSGEYQYQTVEKVDKVIDSTSAGDSFNAAYIAARNYDYDCQHAMKYASMLSALVIQHQGAIIDNAICHDFIEREKLSKRKNNVL